MPTGIWLATDSGDYVLYDAQTSPLHQEHIILHEIGHLVCDHRSGSGDQRLYRQIDLADAESLRQALARSRYSDLQEQEAEMIATLVLERAGRVPSPTLLSGMLGGLESAMGLSGAPRERTPCSRG
ncbi:M48 family metalloprotease [Streptomyces milbemycinicus]|uniref:IrrE N-terminal-like domain-containing protein n=1 Tax=Streptomyces milbemycinicus TaxID=476552 RepID=A0ABW8M2U6_9ACTN